jgi:hypothetical protein
MIAGPRITERSMIAPSSTTTLPSTRLSASMVPVEPSLERLENQAVGFEHIFELAGVFPPTLDHLRPHRQAAIDQVLDGIGDLELVAKAGSNPVDRLEDLGPNM